MIEGGFDDGQFEILASEFIAELRLVSVPNETPG
jgi:hypothetical protein